MHIKNRLKEYRYLLNEVHKLNQRIEKLENTPGKIVSDSVRGSSHSAPYQERVITITGLDQRNKRRAKKLKSILEERANHLGDTLLEIESFISTIPQSDIRQIIDCYYIQGLTWAETAIHVYSDAGEDAPRKALDRFLGKT